MLGLNGVRLCAVAFSAGLSRMTETAEDWDNIQRGENRMKKNRLSIFISTAAAAAVLAGTCSIPAQAAETTATVKSASDDASSYQKTLTIVIDPGHGGKETGAYVKKNGKTVYEKNMNLTIARAMKKELSTYKNVKIYMTRNSDRTVSLTARTAYADRKNADVFFCIHNNARGDAQSYTNGACAIVSTGTYHKELAKASAGLAKKALVNVSSASGVVNRGLLKRKSASRKYPNGKKADYYFITRSCTYYGIPSVLVEHSFMDSTVDYRKMFNNNHLKKVGQADAEAVAEYYGLEKKDGSASYDRTGHYVKFISRYWMIRDGQRYYIKSSEKPAVGWKTINGARYHFKKNGAASIGQCTIGGSLYQFSKKGKMYHSQWGKVNGNYYYYAANGKALKSVTVRIDGKKYRFDDSGICLNR